MTRSAPFWRRYRAVLSSRETLVTTAAGMLIVTSLILRAGGAGFWVHSGAALAAAAIGGLPIAVGAIRGLVRRQVNVDELVTIAIVASVLNGEYLPGAFVAFMMLFGKLLEDLTAERARTALENLGSLIPPVATVRRADRDELVAVSSIQRGETVVVR